MAAFKRLAVLNCDVALFAGAPKLPLFLRRCPKLRRKWGAETAVSCLDGASVYSGCRAEASTALRSRRRICLQPPLTLYGPPRPLLPLRRAAPCAGGRHPGPPSRVGLGSLRASALGPLGPRRCVAPCAGAYAAAGASKQMLADGQLE